VLHLNENTVKSEIHVFTEETLEMCKEVQLVYKSQPNSKYNVIEIPDSVDNTASGYITQNAIEIIQLCLPKLNNLNLPKKVQSFHKSVKITLMINAQFNMLSQVKQWHYGSHLHPVIIQIFFGYFKIKCQTFEIRN
jgi:hypothetical protein